MITIPEYNGKHIGVFGLGKAGDATVASLVASGAQVLAWDDGEAGRVNLKKKYGRKVTVMPLADWPWKELAALVLSPGVPYTHPAPHPAVRMAQAANCPVIGDIELLYRAQPQATYVAITGTNGKSTTTTLIAHILHEAGRKIEVGGNLGTPVLAFAPLGAEGIYVIETSSYQLDLIRSVRFNVALLLNITPDHLDRHGDMQGYIAAKMHAFDRQTPQDVAIIAVDDEHTRAVANVLNNRKLVRVSSQQMLPEGISVMHGILHDRLERGMEWETDLSSIATLTGRHNWQNAAAAYAACRALGVEPAAIMQAMRSFPGLAHRLELVATINGVRYINDSKATNADATQNALAPFDQIYWIAGGKPKAGGIVSLAEYFPQIKHAFLIGEAEEEFARTLEGKVKYTRCGTLDVAVAKAAAMAKDGAVVLLSPACASFDQFKNFEERGEKFRALVKEVVPEASHAS